MGSKGISIKDENADKTNERVGQYCHDVSGAEEEEDGTEDYGAAFHVALQVFDTLFFLFFSSVFLAPQTSQLVSFPLPFLLLELFLSLSLLFFLGCQFLFLGGFIFEFLVLITDFLGFFKSILFGTFIIKVLVNGSPDFFFLLLSVFHF